ncbi:hypothetical protein [Lentimicrobium sp. S6]|uniref:HYC_CC_PP family protein n=1 Tax=Lentimicrobium sp. S6 TaxID=2735872 RepID=UPI00155787FD|nr:hypothetical protein [Lentimicrobium sp. S6]NPD44722.1 hypothetical protein [Lentimicrobium sp. S6]
MMLKKITALFFVLFYLLISVGFTVSLHHCMGETTVNIGEAKSCCCDGEEANNKCCSDVEKLIVWDSDHQLSSAFNFEMNVSFEIKTPFVFSFEEPILDEVTHLFLDLPPPKLQKIFLLIQRFTFYE